MRLIMNEGQLQTVEQVKQFPEGSEALEFRGLTVKENYYWIEEVLIRFSYTRLKKAEKGVIRQYLQKITRVFQVTGIPTDSGVQTDRTGLMGKLYWPCTTFWAPKVAELINPNMRMTFLNAECEGDDVCEILVTLES